MTDLKKAYLEGTLIPFIGSGLSVPFGAPTWSVLAEKLIDECVNDNDSKNYFKNVILKKENDCIKVLDLIVKGNHLTQNMLNQKIKQIIETSINKKVDKNKHNYFDLAELMCACTLTTNYDSLYYFQLQKVCPSEAKIPQDFGKLMSNTQNFTKSDEIKVFNLHGMLEDETTLVTTSDTYINLYENETYKARLNTLFSNNTFLFLGFSFNDIYLKNYVAKYLKINNGIHYILLPETDKEKASELISLGLKTIYYKDAKGHAEGIREVLLDLKSSKKKS
ncbi:MAG: SIR2 family protein [Cetobacterium sp.]|uniref:SIR2 family protein n=1 Tax=Cetobacterium sp. TaxID=2071632 RepID=UPI003F35D913